MSIHQQNTACFYLCMSLILILIKSTGCFTVCMCVSQTQHVPISAICRFLWVHSFFRILTAIYFIDLRQVCMFTLSSKKYYIVVVIRLEHPLEDTLDTKTLCPFVALRGPSVFTQLWHYNSDVTKHRNGSLPTKTIESWSPFRFLAIVQPW